MCIITEEHNKYQQTSIFPPRRQSKKLRHKDRICGISGIDGFIVYFSKIPSSVFVAVHDMMATKRNRLELKTLQSYRKSNINAHETIQEEERN